MRLISSILLFGLVTILYAQDIESFGKADPLTINGGISINQIGYGAIGLPSRRDPYSYFASGNLAFNFYGWSVPLSFTYSNQQGSFSQPFNQYSIHPTYKGYTGHFGYTSMNFSPYTLSGHLFLGGGLEGTVGDFSGALMYGRLLKAVQPTEESPDQAVYQRVGYGSKMTFNLKSTKIDFSLFRGKDLAESVDFSVTDSVTVFPEENLVFNVAMTQQFLERVSMTVDFARSAITRNALLGAQDIQRNKFYGNFGSFFTANTSTGFYDAVKINSNYTGGSYTIGVGYERIDPGYRTHGAYYFVNDIENITLNGSKVLFQGKVNVSATGGVQKDNLNKEKISTMRRFVGSTSVGYTPSNRLSLTGSYSSFQTYTNIRSQFVDINQLTPYDNLDTLNFRQVSQSISLNGNYVLQQSEEKRQMAALNFTYQGAKDEQAGLEQPGGNTFFLISGNYSIAFVPSKLNVSAAFNYNTSTTADINSKALGPSLSVSKSLLENKLNFSSGLSWNQSITNNEVQGSVSSLRLGARYILKEKHNFNLGITTVNRSSPEREDSQAANFTEFTGTLGYSYSFSKGNILSKKE